MKALASLMIAAGLPFLIGGVAHADDSRFLAGFQGKFAGKGMVKISTDAPTVNVTCDFNSNATASSLALDGRCRGFVLVTRDISANLKVSGAKYSGTYIGSRTGPARLNGRRSGNAIDLVISWAKPVNGNNQSQLIVEKRGQDGMRLKVIDLDRKTGKNVVTSQIDLRRT